MSFSRNLLKLGAVCAGLATPSAALAQAEAMPWGGLRGVRVEGELMAFTTGMRAVPTDAALLGSARAERLLSPRFSREGAKQIVAGSVALAPTAGRGAGGGGRGGPPPNTRIVYEDTAPGVVTVEVQVTANAEADLAGIFYFMHLPAEDFADASIELTDASTPPADRRAPAGIAKGLGVAAAHRRIEIAFAEPVRIATVRRESGVDIYFPVCTGRVTVGQVARLAFTIKASGAIDRTPAHLALDLAHPGQPFAGVGGNFRIQNRQLDPPVVDYNLANLRVAWSRVNVPLDLWHPVESADPLANARAGKLADGARVAMEMARTLAQKKIPLVLSVWQAPAWSLGPLETRPRDPNSQTRRINPEKWDALCKSIGGYVTWLKEGFGVEAEYFSFNESDIGYDILQSPREHTESIKRIGAHFAAHGIRAKWMLGDTGDPTGIDFINDAMADSEALKYVGAVSYHSWRGGTDEQFIRWGEAARKLNVPLFVGEGGMDADAHRYPAIFLEPWYALVEIAEYVDICRLSQPLSILQWQLTADYSPLTGGRNGEPLVPAQRFWQLKQLGLTPVGAAALPIACDRPALAACAFRDGQRGTVAVHVVNSGAARTATVTGLPKDAKELRVFVTDAQRGVKEVGRVAASGGSARVVLDAMSYTTLLSAD